MQTVLSSSVVLWLVGANLLLVVFIIIDRFRINQKKANDLEDQFVKEALNNLHSQIRKANKDLSDNTLQFQQNAQNQTLELLASIRSTIFSRYETEFKLIDESVKKNIQNIDGEVNHVLQDVKKYIENNNTQISGKYNGMSEELEVAIKNIIAEADQKINKTVELANTQTQQYMQEQINQRISKIINEVFHNNISLKDHERLIEDSIQEFLGQRK